MRFSKRIDPSKGWASGLVLPLLLGLLLHCHSSTYVPTYPPFRFQYPNPQVVGIAGVALPQDVPYNPVPGQSPGTSAAALYTVSPALPAGLNLDPGTGILSGLPTTPTPETSYLVTATNGLGATTATLTIAIYAAGAPYGLTYAYLNGLEGYPVTPDVPNFSGTTTATFSVEPTLPAGLTLDPATGIISGTPTIVTFQTLYQATATNAFGSATATLQIEISPASAPVFSYPAGSMALNLGTAMAADQPAVSSLPAVQAYAISPALPAGLVLDPQMGTLSGTPTALSPLTTYQVTATNPLGSTQTSFTLSVNPAGWPLIGSFAASPATLQAGQFTTFSWNVDDGSAADTLFLNDLAIDFLDNGNTYSVVPPAGSTLYTLQAINAVGTSTAQVTVTLTE